MCFILSDIFQQYNKLREQGINSIIQLDDLIEKSIEAEMKSLSQDMENVNTINKYREIYKYHKKILKTSNLQKNIIANFPSIK